MTIENRDTVAIDSLRLYVTGNTYSLGTILPGKSKSIGVISTDDSHIELSHSGSREKMLVDTYFEPGYTGIIDIDITADSLLNTVSEMKLSPQ